MQSYMNILYSSLGFLISQSAAILPVKAYGEKKRKKKVHFWWEIKKWFLFPSL